MIKTCATCRYEDRLGYQAPCRFCPDHEVWEPKIPAETDEGPGEEDGSLVVGYAARCGNDAAALLRHAAELIEERGRERDKPDGERSMARTVAMFNAKYDTQMTEEQGWSFMVFLKHARSVSGAFNRDDYEDAVAYEALRAESAIK